MKQKLIFDKKNETIYKIENVIFGDDLDFLVLTSYTKKGEGAKKNFFFDIYDAVNPIASTTIIKKRNELKHRTPNAFGVE